jgi:serine/threonine protein phosphatase 1
MTLVIGDIHGCYDELCALLDKSGVQDDERIIAVGDLLDKGTQPVAVYDFFTRTTCAESVRGNHEQKHLTVSIGAMAYPDTQRETRDALGSRYAQALRYMRRLPPYIELDEAIVLHGYYDPRYPLYKQHPYVLIGTSSGEDYILDQVGDDWYEQLDMPKPIIVGHRDYSDGQQAMTVIDGQFYGIDTRCVYGGYLTAIRLPQWEIISVPARNR